MIVLDASVLVELLLGTETGRSAAGLIADPRVGLHVPQLTAYDALYVVLAEALDSVLLSCDVWLAHVSGLVLRVQLVP